MTIMFIARVIAGIKFERAKYLNISLIIIWLMPYLIVTFWGSIIIVDFSIPIISFIIYCLIAHKGYSLSVIIAVFGINAIFIGQRFFNANTSANIIIVAIGTSILASGLVGLIAYINDIKIKTRKRKIILANLLDCIVAASKEIHDQYYDNKMDFYYVNYSKFVLEFNKYCKDNSDLRPMYSYDVEMSLARLRKEIGLLNGERVLLLNNDIFNNKELNALFEFGEYLNRTSKKKKSRLIADFFKQLHYMAKSVDEVRLLVIAFGRDKEEPFYFI